MTEREVRKAPLSRTSVWWLLSVVLLLAAPTRADEQREEIPTFGLSCKTPEGWTRVPETAFNEAARWERRDEDGDRDGFLSIHIGKLDEQQGLDELCAKIATRFKGTVRDGTTKVDNETAKTIQVKRSGVFGLALCVVVGRGRRVYLIEASSTSISAVEPDLDKLVAQLKFIAIATPASGIDATKEWRQFGLKLQVPASFRPGPSEKETVRWMAIDSERLKPAFGVKVENLPLKDGDSHEDVRKTFEKNVRDSRKDPSLEYARIGTGPRRWLTGVARLMDDPEDKTTTRWGLIASDAEHIVLLSFVIESHVEDEDRRVYEKACEAIMKSVSLDAGK
jgi:hypothetical protein